MAAPRLFPEPDPAPSDASEITSKIDALHHKASGLIRRYPELKPLIIDNLLRRAEVMNIVAATKTYKSFLTLDLAMSVQSGSPWLGFGTHQTNVLLIDNELHAETVSSRCQMIHKAKLSSDNWLGDWEFTGEFDFDIVCTRGKKLTLRDIGAVIDRVQYRSQSKLGLVILDAFYRFVPPGTDENSNAAITELYNEMDFVAQENDLAVVIVHHTSKGSQYGKSVTDVGSGAGSQSRAADAHFVIRPYRIPNHVVVESAVRSSPPMKPLVLEWRSPLYYRTEIEYKAAPKIDATLLGVGEFVEKYVPLELCSREGVISAAVEGGVKRKVASGLLDRALADGVLTQVKQPGTRRLMISRKDG